MTLDVPRLRRWFAAAAVLLVLVVAGWYAAGRWAQRRVARELPKQLGVEIQQSTEGFTLSRSEGGRTLFTVKASRAVRLTAGGRAELKDVSVVIYGRRANRFDQIYGSDFEYDPDTGNIAARGEVHIDLESDVEGAERPDLAPPVELKNPIHLKTRGLVFNHKTGKAETREKLEFRVPWASGTAVGASYDSATNVLRLGSQIEIRSGSKQAVINAASGVISKEPRQVELMQVRAQQGEQHFEADRVRVLLRDDNTVERVMAEGNVTAAEGGASPATLRAPRAEFLLNAAQMLQSAILSGGVTMESSDGAAMKATAGRVLLEFAPGNRLARVRASENARLERRPQGLRRRGFEDGQRVEIAADALDFQVRQGKWLEKAATVGAGQITLTPISGTAASTVITAAAFEAAFGKGNRLQSLRGAPDARITSNVPGGPLRVSTSRQVLATFREDGSVSAVEQEGDVRYTEGARTASAEKARYLPAADEIVLTGSPRFTEGAMSTTAQTLRFSRREGEATAEGDVKTTYQPAGGQAGASVFSGNNPIHVTARSMVARRASATARYSGGVRLWQGANVIEAPAVEFDREHRTLRANAGSGGQVSTVFVQADEKGNLTPVNVTATTLRYSDAERRAHFEGGVTLRGAGFSVAADRLEVELRPGGREGPSRLEQAVAQGRVGVWEGERRASGERLVYTAAEGKFVLTGTPQQLPSIFDAELGATTGDSLTFYSRDDRVLVESSPSTRSVTQTRVSKK
ncbi:MAG TPA: LptA/OstA family protein [Terriglobales bacterium]|nr:LptA/OstA family protein [Terriglobales bacterium]